MKGVPGIELTVYVDSYFDRCMYKQHEEKSRTGQVPTAIRVFFLYSSFVSTTRRTVLVVSEILLSSDRAHMMGLETMAFAGGQLGMVSQAYR